MKHLTVSICSLFILCNFNTLLFASDPHQSNKEPRSKLTRYLSKENEANFGELNPTKIKKNLSYDTLVDLVEQLNFKSLANEIHQKNNKLQTKQSSITVITTTKINNSNQFYDQIDQMNRNKTDDEIAIIGGLLTVITLTALPGACTIS